MSWACHRRIMAVIVIIIDISIIVVVLMECIIIVLIIIMQSTSFVRVIFLPLQFISSFYDKLSLA